MTPEPPGSKSWSWGSDSESVVLPLATAAKAPSFHTWHLEIHIELMWFLGLDPPPLINTLENTQTVDPSDLGQRQEGCNVRPYLGFRASSWPAWVT